MGAAQVTRIELYRGIAERDHDALIDTIEARMKADFPSGSDATRRFLSVDTVVRILMYTDFLQ